MRAIRLESEELTELRETLRGCLNDGWTEQRIIEFLKEGGYAWTLDEVQFLLAQIRDRTTA